MKVLFDVSALEYSRLAARHRTGVYRVAVSLLRALARRPGLELIAYSGAGGMFLSRRVLNQEGLGSVPLWGSPVWGTLAFGLLTVRNLAYRRGLRSLAGGLSKALEWVRERRFRAERSRLSEARWYLSPMEAAPAVLRRLRGLRIAIVIHDLIPLRLPGYAQDEGDPTRWFPQMIRSLALNDTLFTVSQFTKDDFLRLFPNWNPERLVVAPNAVDAERFGRSVPHSGRLPSPAPAFLTVSTLEPRKRLDTLVRAFALYRDAGGRAELHVCGANRDNHVEQVLALVPESVRPFVRFLGYVDDAALVERYRSCLAFLFLSEYEGFGLPVLEAMTYGAPVAVSNRTSLPEVVGDAGVIVPPDDPQALAEVMGRFDTDAVWRRERARAARAQAARFSWERTAAIVEQTLTKETR